jgi:hypothetical protein
MSWHVFALSVLGVDALIECAEPETHALLTVTHGAMRAMRTPTAFGSAAGTAVRYEVGRLNPTSPCVVRRDGETRASARDAARLLWAFEGDLVIEIQRRRPDLYFVHAAVLELGGRAFVLVGESGAGKSTTAWTLLHHGFGFLSDELAPVDLVSFTVLPYLRALCLKDEPPGRYDLPATAVRTSSSIHISTRDLPGHVWREPLGLEGIFFLRYDPEAAAPSVRPMTGAEGAVHLYTNTLNALAHEADGLDGAIRIAVGRPCFELVSAEPTATAMLVKRTAEQVLREARDRSAARDQADDTQVSAPISLSLGGRGRG